MCSHTLGLRHTCSTGEPDQCVHLFIALFRCRLVVDSAGDPELQSWSTKFHFETDQKRLNSIREVKARLKPLEDKIDRFNASRHVRYDVCFSLV